MQVQIGQSRVRVLKESFFINSVFAALSTYVRGNVIVLRTNANTVVFSTKANGNYIKQMQGIVT